MTDPLWYRADVDGAWHLPASMTDGPVQRMTTVCGVEAIPLGGGLPFASVPPLMRCMACTLQHGTVLADRRRSTLRDMHGEIADGLTKAVEAAQIEAPHDRVTSGETQHAADHES